jgi:hypothetical protein
MNEIGTEVPDPAMLMFTDETAKDKRMCFQKTGWAKVGKRCAQRKCFVQGHRYSILPVLTLDGLITWDIIEGSVTSERFVEFLRENVVCACLFASDFIADLGNTRYLSPIHIPDLGVYSFWTTVAYTMLTKSGHLSRTKLVCIPSF